MSDTTVPKINPAGQAQTLVTPLSNLTAMLWIAWFSLREMSRRKRIISLGAINLLPVIVVVIIRVWFPDQGITAHSQLSSLTHDVFISFLIPVVAIAVGVSAIGEQVEEGTIVYLWTRPVRRRAIYLGRLVAAQTVSTLLLSGSLILCFLVMLSNGLGIITWDFLVLYFRTFLIIALGAFSYAALFASMGTFLKKPVVPAILFAFVWEGLVSEIPARIKVLSLRFHLQNLVERPATTVDDLPGVLDALLSTARNADPVAKTYSVGALLAIMLVAMAFGIWRLRLKEIEK